jgi:hypothetical protein
MSAKATTGDIVAEDNRSRLNAKEAVFFIKMEPIWVGANGCQ